MKSLVVGGPETSVFSEGLRRFSESPRHTGREHGIFVDRELNPDLWKFNQQVFQIMIQFAPLTASERYLANDTRRIL